jgi:hypothetical protein
MVLSALLVSGFALAAPPSVLEMLPSRYAAADDSADSDSESDNVEFVDAGLKGKLGVSRVGSEASPNDLLSVFVGLKNKTSQTLNLQVETIYKDSEGNALNAGSWITMTLKPHEEKEYRSTSISQRFDPDVVTPLYLIRIRRAVKASAAAH